MWNAFVSLDIIFIHAQYYVRFEETIAMEEKFYIGTPVAVLSIKRLQIYGINF